MNDSPDALSVNDWARTGRFLSSTKTRIDRLVEDRVRADRSHCAGLVEQRDLDRLSADRPGLDRRIRAGAGDGVQAGNEIRHGVVGGVVLDLDQAEDVGVDRGARGARGDDLGALAGQFALVVGAAAVLAAARSADRAGIVERGEVVEDVERCDRDVAADVVGCRSARLVDVYVP